MVEQEYVENGVKLSYIGTPDPAGDPYAGFDRFGRVIDQRWVKSSTDLERIKYAYSVSVRSATSFSVALAAGMIRRVLSQSI